MTVLQISLQSQIIIGFTTIITTSYKRVRWERDDVNIIRFGLIDKQ